MFALGIDDFTWRELFPTSYNFGPMRKSGCGLLAFHDQMLAVGGFGSEDPVNPSPSAEYEKAVDGFVYTNENHIYDWENGEY